jgi:hypothetical protein
MMIDVQYLVVVVGIWREYLSQGTPSPKTFAVKLDAELFAGRQETPNITPKTSGKLIKQENKQAHCMQDRLIFEGGWKRSSLQQASHRSLDSWKKDFLRNK